MTTQEQIDELADRLNAGDVAGAVAVITRSPQLEDEMADDSKIQKSREGLKPLTVWIKPEQRDELKVLAIHEQTTVQALIEEAVEEILAKHKRKRR